MRWRRPVLALLLVLGACSGDDAPAPSTTTTTVAPTTTVELSIAGDGLMLVRRLGEMFFTPSASFTLDDDGKLATAAGDVLQGWPAADDGTIDVNAPTEDLVTEPGFEVDERGMVTVGGTRAGQLTIALFDHPEALERVEGGLLRPTADSGLAAISIVGVGERGPVVVESG